VGLDGFAILDEPHVLVEVDPQLAQQGARRVLVEGDELLELEGSTPLPLRGQRAPQGEERRHLPLSLDQGSRAEGVSRPEARQAWIDAVEGAGAEGLQGMLYGLQVGGLPG